MFQCLNFRGKQVGYPKTEIRQSTRIGRLGAAWLFACVLATGCNPGPEMAPVTGTVSFRGKPLAYGTVMFQHSSGGQPAVGEIQADGSFTMMTPGQGEGVRVGSQLVRVTSYEGNDPAKAKTLGSGEPVLGRSLIPLKYSSFGSSGLTVEVKPGGEPQSFDLELSE